LKTVTRTALLVIFFKPGKMMSGHYRLLEYNVGLGPSRRVR
jgi:hypothetical protein